MIGTITLNPSIDQHVLVRQLVKDDANRAQKITETAGGKGINVSKVVRELGGRTRAYALLGGFTGEYLKELALPFDFPIIACGIKGKTRINTVITDVHDGTQTRISAPGPVMKNAEIRRFFKILLSARPKPFLWALGGSISAGMSRSIYRDLIRDLQKRGTPCILDTDNEALTEGVRAKPFMIKPNEHEMHRLYGRPLHSIREYLSAARHFAGQGVRLVIVSLGAKGALFVTAKRAFHATAPRVKVQSKVWAGDSLIGGVAFGLLKKMSLEDAARLGIAASSSAVMREAPRLCRRSDIAPLACRVVIRPL